MPIQLSQQLELEFPGRRATVRVTPAGTPSHTPARTTSTRSTSTSLAVVRFTGKLNIQVQAISAGASESAGPCP